MAFEIVVAAVLFAATFLYYLTAIRNSKVNKFLKLVSGPPQLPLLGNMLDFNIPNDELAQMVQFDWPNKYGPRYAFSIYPRTYFTSRKAEDVEKLLSSTAEIDKGMDYDFLRVWLGDGLLTSKGARWYKHRKMLTPSFHFKILEEFLVCFNSNAKIFVDLLKRDSDEGRNVMNISPYITLCALDIICETAMGKPVHAQLERDSEYVKAINGVVASMLYRALRPWLLWDFLYYNLTPTGRQERKNLKLLHKFTETVIQERKKEMTAVQRNEANQKNKQDSQDEVFLKKKSGIAFMDLLLEIQANDPASLTDAQIREETDTFMFEGHDTTSASLMWTVLLLGTYPECQDKVLAELDSIFEGDKERPITTMDLSKMKYLEYCVKESLRLFPSVPFMSRELQNDLKLDENVTIPAGINFSLFNLSVHRNPEIFPDPEAFKPERFYPKNATGRHPYAYVPFSAGPRNCIGQKFALMEEKVVLANLFRNFRVEAVTKREDVTIMMEIITRPKEDIKVKLIPR